MLKNVATIFNYNCFYSYKKALYFTGLFLFQQSEQYHLLLLINFVLCGIIYIR